MSNALQSITRGRLGMRTRTPLGGHFSSDMVPTGPLVLPWNPGPSGTISNCNYVPVNDATARLTAITSSPGIGAITATVCQWQTSSVGTINNVAYVAYNASTPNAQLSSAFWLPGGPGTNAPVYSTGYDFPLCPDKEGNVSGFGSAPAPATAWLLRKGQWNVSVTVSGIPAAVANLNVAGFPHRLDSGDQFQDFFTSGSNGRIVFSGSVLGGSWSGRVSLRGSALWHLNFGYLVRSPYPYSISTGDTAFDLSISATRVGD